MGSLWGGGGSLCLLATCASVLCPQGTLLSSDCPGAVSPSPCHTYSWLSHRSCRRQTGEAVQVGTPTCKSSQGVPGAARTRPGWDKRTQTQPGVGGEAWEERVTSVSSANLGLWARLRQVKSLLPPGTLGCADYVFSLEITLVFIFSTPSKWK